MKIISPTFGSAIIFRGAVFGNETIRFNALFNETGTGKQIIAFRAENGTQHYGEQANYHFLITKNTIELIRRNHDGSTTTLIGSNGVLRNTITYTSALYTSSQLVEISAQNQSNGVKIGLRIGSTTWVGVVDTTPGYLTNAGFLMFNTGKLTGTMYISDPETILGINENKTEAAGILYPNPNDGYEFSIRIDEPIRQVEFYAPNGTEIPINSTKNTSNDYLIRPKTSLTSGVYLLNVDTGKGLKSYKVVVK